MNEYMTLQDVQDKLIKELEDLNNNLKELEVKRQNCSQKTSMALTKKHNDEQTFRNLKSQQKKLLHKYDIIATLLTIGISAILAPILTLGSGLLAYLILENIIKIYSVSLEIVSILGCAGVGLGVYLYSSNKIYKIFEKHIQRKIMKSSKYRNLLEVVNQTKIALDLSNSNYELEKEKSKEIYDNYSKCLKVRDEKRSFLEYLNKEMNPVETTVHKSKELKPNNK